MKFHPLPIVDAFLIEIDRADDARGYFARTWCIEEFAEVGLPTALVQASISFNKKRGTVRGMHMQLPPSEEAKLVRCSRGAILDVIMDMRPNSKTFLQHYQVELTAAAANALYIPPMLAHGFQTLADDTDVFYQMTDMFSPQLSTGWRWNDSAFGIKWPIEMDVTIGTRDAAYPDFNVDRYIDELSKQRL